jgi:vitamin-K-epoxide reductase (warfarin-sensitive)
MKNRVATLLNVLFALCGIGLSAASLRSHYATSATEYCDLSAVFNCDLVNRSKFSEMFGIPVALIGLIGYLVLLALITRRQRNLKILRFCMSLVGLTFALYLAYIEEHVLRTWCLLCIGSLFAIAGLTIVSAVELWGTGRKSAT